jgi:hypothetical protein
MDREEERLLFPSSFAFIPAESFAEAADASGSGEFFFTYFFGSPKPSSSIDLAWVRVAKR